MSDASLPWLGIVAGSVCFLVAGILLIALDRKGMSRGSRQGEPSSWYERPLPWFGGASITVGLVVPVDSLIASLPGTAPESLFFFGYFGISCLLVCGLLILYYYTNKPKPSTSLTSQAQPAASQLTFVRENPLLTMVRTGMYPVAYFCVMAIWSVFGFFFHFIPALPLLDYYMLAFSGLLMTGSIVWAFVQHSQLKRIERLRVELATRAGLPSPPLGIFSPSPQGALLLAPPIVARHNRKALAWWVGTGLILGLAYSMPFSQNLTGLVSNVSAIFLGTILIGGAYFLLIFYVRRGSRLKVEATLDGLTSVNGFMPKFMFWPEARLFVSYQIPELFGSKTMRIYELSSPSNVVQWTRVMDTSSPFAFWQPILPMDEYQQQMERFNELVSAKTGLPLHDLNERKPPERRSDAAQEYTFTQFPARDY